MKKFSGIKSHMVFPFVSDVGILVLDIAISVMEFRMGKIWMGIWFVFLSISILCCIIFLCFDWKDVDKETRIYDGHSYDILEQKDLH